MNKSNVVRVFWGGCGRTGRFTLCVPKEQLNHGTLTTCSIQKSNMSGITVTVCGGGNAAHVAAGMYASQGAKVNLFFSFEDEAKRFRDGMEANPKGAGVTVEAKEQTLQGKPNCVSHKPEDVIPEADIILIIVPAFAHEPILNAIKPHLKPGAAVGAVPGPGGFDLLAQHVLADVISEKNIILFGGSSLPWACRFEDYGARVSLLGIKSEVDISVKPNTKENCDNVAGKMDSLHVGTKFNAGSHFLVTSMWPTNCIIHTGVTYGLWHDWDGTPLKEAPLFYQVQHCSSCARALTSVRTAANSLVEFWMDSAMISKPPRLPSKSDSTLT